MIEIRQFAAVGRSLVATQEFRPGELVVADRVVLRWDAEAALAEDIERALAKYPSVNRVLAAAVNAFVARADDAAVQRCVLDLHAPDLPISKPTLDLFDFCREVAAARPALKDIVAKLPDRLPGAKHAVGDVAALLAYVAMAVKVNAHRAANGHWCIFALASKLAHSCDPNLFFLPPDELGNCSFVATRHIATDELLSFSYLGGKNLLLPTQQRQEKLRASHLFICRCSRCESHDYLRQLRCPNGCGSHEVVRGVAHIRLTTSLPPCIARSGSPLSMTDDDAFPDKVWRCRNCGSSFSDGQLASTVLEEQRLMEDVAAIQQQSYRLIELKELTLDVAATLGYGHSAYVTMVSLMMNYFRLMVQNGCLEAFPVFMCWAARYLDGLALQCVEVQGTKLAKSNDDFCHMLTAAAVLTVTALYGKANAEDRRRFKPVVCAWARCAEPLVAAVYPDDPRRRELAVCAGMATPEEMVPIPGAADIVYPGLHTSTARAVIELWPDEGNLRSAINAPPLIGGSLTRHSSSRSPAAAERLSGTPVEDDHSLVAMFDLWDKIVATQHMRQALQ